jgi:hypothetical protein
MFGQVTLSCADQLADATRAFDSGDFAHAATLFKPLAESGNAIAQYRMGLLYSQGLELEPDYRVALQWYMRAAEANNADAQRELGLLYSSGRGVRQNFKQAVNWFRQSAEQGDALAQFHLGKMHADGTGVPKDYKLAEYWYRKSATQGYAAAQFELGQCFLNGSCSKRDEKAALGWLDQAMGNAVDAPSRERYASQRDMLAEQLASRTPQPVSPEASQIPTEKQAPENAGEQLVLSKPRPEDHGQPKSPALQDDEHKAVEEVSKDTASAPTQDIVVNASGEVLPAVGEAELPKKKSEDVHANELNREHLVDAAQDAAHTSNVAEPAREEPAPVPWTTEAERHSWAKKEINEEPSTDHAEAPKVEGEPAAPTEPGQDQPANFAIENDANADSAAPPADRPDANQESQDASGVSATDSSKDVEQVKDVL